MSEVGERLKEDYSSVMEEEGVEVGKGHFGLVESDLGVGDR